MRQFVGHGALVLAGTMLANVMTYWYYVAAARSLGVEAAGLFTSLIAAMLLLSLPASVAATVVAKVVADATARGNLGTARALGAAIAAALVPLALVAGSVAWLGNGALRAFFHTADPVVIGLATAGFVLTFPLAPQRAVLQGASAYTAFSLSALTDATGKAIVGALLLFVVPHGPDALRFALAGFVVATFAAYAVNVVLTTRGTTRPLLPTLSRALVVRLALGVALPVAAVTAMTFGDAVLVRHYLPAREAGLYNSAIALVGRAIVTAVQFIPTVLLPRAAAALFAGKSPARFLAIAGLSAAAMCLGVLAFVGAFPKFVVVAVSGPAFLDAAPLLLPYGIAMSALGGVTVLSSYLIGVDRHGFAIPLTLVAVLELAAIAIVHPNIATVVGIVIVGHSLAFLSTFVDTLLSLRTRRSIVGSAENSRR